MKVLKMYLLGVLIVWGGLYLVYCLLDYELLNPIQYIIDWPEYSVNKRTALLGLGVVLVAAISFPICVYRTLK